MNKSKRKGLVFLIDQMQLAEKLLTREELGELYAALCAYATQDEPPKTQEMSRAWNAIFHMMSAAQDRAQTLYEETCERNRRAANARWHKQCL